MNKALETFVKAKKDDSVVHIKDATQREGKYTESYSIGFSVIDEAMKGGVREGDLIVITGKSGAGKTTLLQNIAVNLSKLALPCLFFSYEVLIDNLYAKFKEMRVEDKNLLVYTPKINTSGNLKWIKEKIKEGYKEKATKFVFIDHIDFLTPSTVSSTDQRRIILRDICQELKNIAIDLKVVVFLVCHVKKVQGREIEMQDVTESSAPFQISDYLIAAERENTMENSNQGCEMTSRSSIRILKNRMTGDLKKINFTLIDNIIVPL